MIPLTCSTYVLHLKMFKRDTSKRHERRLVKQNVERILRDYTNTCSFQSQSSQTHLDPSSSTSLQSQASPTMLDQNLGFHQTGCSVLTSTNVEIPSTSNQDSHLEQMDDVDSLTNVNTHSNLMTNYESEFGNSLHLESEPFSNGSVTEVSYNSGSDDWESLEGNLEIHKNIVQSKPASIFLPQWALKNNITHTALNELLVWFATNPDDSHLPVDSRTLLHTPRNVNTGMGEGRFFYFGIFNGLLKIFKRHDKDDCDTYFLDFNVDGLPIHKSTNISFWPILCRVYNYINESPFPIAIYCGPHKPPLFDFFF